MLAFRNYISLILLFLPAVLFLLFVFYFREHHLLEHRQTFPYFPFQFWLIGLFGIIATAGSSTQDYFHTGGTRITYYEDSLSFTEKITELIPEKKLVLQVETVKQRKEKIKDVQMLVGSRFFNIQEDTYELKQLSGSQTEITLTSKVLVNTPFNWYSKFWVNLFLSDILTSELEKIETILNNESI